MTHTCSSHVCVESEAWGVDAVITLVGWITKRHGHYICGPACGAGPYVASGSSLLLIVTVEDRRARWGFTAVFSSVHGPKATQSKPFDTLRPTRQELANDCAVAGEVTQSGGGSVDFSRGYSNLLDCTYTFTAKAGSVARVSFVGTFDTQPRGDNVTIRAASNTSVDTPPVAVVSGHLGASVPGAFA